MSHLPKPDPTKPRKKRPPAEKRNRGQGIAANFPEFIVRSGTNATAVTCPRKPCGITHWVDEDAWRDPERSGVSPTTKTRCCPYCFYPSRVPPDTRKGEWCPVCHTYHVNPGEKTDAGKLTRQCPLLSGDDPRNVFANFP